MVARAYGEGKGEITGNGNIFSFEDDGNVPESISDVYTPLRIY